MALDKRLAGSSSGTMVSGLDILSGDPALPSHARRHCPLSAAKNKIPGQTHQRDLSCWQLGAAGGASEAKAGATLSVSSSAWDLVGAYYAFRESWLLSELLRATVHTLECEEAAGHSGWHVAGDQCMLGS